MKSFRQYLRQRLNESDPQKYDVGKKIDNETSEVPVWQGGIPPSEIVDDQVFETDEEIEKDEEQQAKKDEEQQAKRWVKRYNEKFMSHQQERGMQPPSALQAGALAPVPPDDSDRELELTGFEQWSQQLRHEANRKEIWKRQGEVPKLPELPGPPPEIDFEPETSDNGISRSG